MKFAKEFLQEGIYDDSTVFDQISHTTRWSIVYRRVFQFENKFYETMYSRGSTENQEERPYEYEDDEIECKEVFPQEITITVYN
jgi:hypothetical protein